MYVGFPGLGIGGLFYLLSALVAPAVEICRALRGRSTRATRRLAARHFGFAVVMLVALDAAFRAVALLAGPGPGNRPGPAGKVADAAVAFPIAPVLVTLALLALLLAGAKVAELVLRHRRKRGQSGSHVRRVARAGLVFLSAIMALLVLIAAFDSETAA